MKARGTISSSGGHEAHLSAIAYMSDSYFVGTIARVHNLWRYSTQRKSKSKATVDEDVLKKLLAMDDAELKRQRYLDDADIKRIQRVRNGEKLERLVSTTLSIFTIRAALGRTSGSLLRWRLRGLEMGAVLCTRGCIRAMARLLLVVCKRFVQLIDGGDVDANLSQGLVRLKQPDSNGTSKL
jgi:hypothetical protein